MALVVYENDDLEDAKEVGASPSASFVGLSNQGATCYLNGLLQTMFMTPEFRRAMFNWRYDSTKDGPEDECIPLQLQKLFGFLNLSKEKAVDTISLTKSFGWEGSEVYQQQDVQELTRVLFDALEISFKATDSEEIIDQLYAGELVDYLRCIDVDYETERVDKFLDFSLAIIPFGSTVACKNVIECVEMYLRPEVLDGDNKYYAEKYEEKVDAMKGLKISKLPKILSIHLKRFVFDFSSANITIKKLNDIVKFPMVLDMNKYVGRRANKKKKEGDADAEAEEDSSSSKSNSSDKDKVCEFESFLQEQLNNLRREQGDKNKSSSEEDLKGADLETGDANKNKTETSEPSNESKSDPFEEPFNPFEDDDFDVESSSSSSSSKSKKDPTDKEFNEAIDNSQLQYKIEDIPSLLETRGEWIYELYAVLMHSGSVGGGHYYAYIKDLDSKQWWNFNDSCVTTMKEEEVTAAAWGSTYSRPNYSSAYNTSYSSAYSTMSNYNSQIYGTSKSSGSGSSGSDSSTKVLSGANAYMLMYRKACPKNDSNGIVTLPSIEDVPEYIRDMVKIKEHQLAEQKAIDFERKSRIGLRVYFNGKERRVQIKKTQTYLELAHAIWRAFELEKEELFKDIDLKQLGLSSEDVKAAGSAASEAKEEAKTDEISSSLPLQCIAISELIRVRDYNQYTKNETKVHCVQAKGLLTLDQMVFYDLKDLKLEIKAPEDAWSVWFEDGISVKVNMYDPTADSICSDGDEETIRLPKGATLGDLKSALLPAVGKWYKKVRIIKITEPSRHDTNFRGDVYLQNSKELKKDHYFYDNIKVYCEEEDDDDHNNCSGLKLTLTDKQSKVIARFGLQKLIITINLDREGHDTVKMDVSKKWVLTEMRKHIATKLDLPEMGFKILRMYVDQL